MNCMGQYYHPLYFPELAAVRQHIADDCLALFDSIKESLPVPNAMVDFAWIAPGVVLLIEVNPLTEGLGSFPASTGLFDWDADRELIQGLASPRIPFELRLRSEPETSANLKIKSRVEWRDLIYGKYS